MTGEEERVSFLEIQKFVRGQKGSSINGVLSRIFPVWGEFLKTNV